MPRVGLNRAEVLRAAVAMADAEGLPAVTMRRLATELGVEAMSLYNHIADKKDLHQGLSDRVWAEVDLALEETQFRVALHSLCGSAYRAMVAHPWFLSLPVTYGGERRLHVINATLAHVRGSGVSPESAFHALHVLDGFVAGYAWQAIGYTDIDATLERGREMLAQVDPASLPHLMEHARQHMDAVPPGDGFIIGLDMILDGLERMRP